MLFYHLLFVERTAAAVHLVQEGVLREHGEEAEPLVM